MRSAHRLLASTTATAKKPATNSRLRKPPPPSLEHFIQRQRVLSLYRDIVRNLFRIPKSDREKRNEMIAYARNEFERHRQVDDITQIRYLISTGKTDFQGMERYIDELAHRK